MSRFSVEGKLAMVTGARRGIGLGAARALGESGARVVLVARSEEALKRAAEELGAAKIDAAYSAYDLQNTEGIAAWFDECVAQFGQPDILVNSAEIQRRGLATEPGGRASRLHDERLPERLPIDAAIEVACASRAHVHHDGARSPVHDAPHGDFQFRATGKLVQLTDVAVHQVDPWQDLANRLLAPVHLGLGRYAPLRIPIQVDGNGHAGLSRRA